MFLKFTAKKFHVWKNLQLLCSWYADNSKIWPRKRQNGWQLKHLTAVAAKWYQKQRPRKSFSPAVSGFADVPLLYTTQIAFSSRRHQRRRQQHHHLSTMWRVSKLDFMMWRQNEISINVDDNCTWFINAHFRWFSSHMIFNHIMSQYPTRVKVYGYYGYYPPHQNFLPLIKTSKHQNMSPSHTPPPIKQACRGRYHEKNTVFSCLWSSRQKNHTNSV